MNYKKSSKALISISTWGLAMGFACNAMAATPFTTVPWNGHVGAASFTFDDAMDDQIQNLTPILEEIPDVRVTFFLSNMGGNRLKAAGAGFAKLAKMGNEIGNHTDNHLQLPDQSEDKLKSEITDFASEIEKVMAENGAEISVTSHATPFCANNEKVSNEISKHHFINRDGGWHGRNDWDTEPKWLEMASRIWNSSATATTELLGALDTAAYIGDFTAANPWEVQVKGGSWLVLLNHGVSDEGGMSITPADIKAAFQRAVKNDLWTAPFSTVGAYHRAHFTLDKAEAVADGEGYKVSWTMPHEHMPKSIPLKVKLNSEFTKTFGDLSIHADGTVPSIVLEQKGKTIWPDSNGVYTIEFADLSLSIRLSSETPSSSSIESSSSETSGFTEKHFERSRATYTVFDLNGNRLGNTNGFNIPDATPQGTYIIRAEAPGMSPQVKTIKKDR